MERFNKKVAIANKIMGVNPHMFENNGCDFSRGDHFWQVRKGQYKGRDCWVEYREAGNWSLMAASIRERGTGLILAQANFSLLH